MNLFWFSVNVLCLLNSFSQECNGIAVPARRHVCIIGAGYSGLATARHMKEYGLNFTVFEATKYIGGTWRFDPHVGTDEDGLPLFTSMYKDLRTNTPRQTLEFGGFPMPEDTPSYPSGPCFYKYLESFAKHFDLLKYIKFRSVVTSVKRNGRQWMLTYWRTDNYEKQTEICNFVVVANGLYSRPQMPNIEGQQEFKGKIIHSHDYKESEPFRNRSVLVVGAGPSGLDVVVLLSNVTSKLVYSHHVKFKEGLFPKNVIHKPDIDYFMSTGAVFEDGSYEEFEYVVICTGFEYDHEFLDKSSELALSPKFIMPLYEHIVNIKLPSMVFVGKLRTIVARIYDVQAEYVAALAAKKFKLPPQDIMLITWANYLYSMLINGTNILKMNVLDDHYDVNKYLKNICREAGIAAPPPILDKIKEYNINYRLENLLQYRDFDYEIVNETQFKTNYNPRGDYCPIID